MNRRIVFNCCPRDQVKLTLMELMRTNDNRSPLFTYPIWLEDCPTLSSFSCNLVLTCTRRWQITSKTDRNNLLRSNSQLCKCCWNGWWNQLNFSFMVFFVWSMALLWARLQHHSWLTYAWTYVIGQTSVACFPLCRWLVCNFLTKIFNRPFTMHVCLYQGARKQYLHFLDQLRNQPTHTGLYSKWFSFVPLHKKRNLGTLTPPHLWHRQLPRTGAHGRNLQLLSECYLATVTNSFLPLHAAILNRKHGVRLQRDSSAEPFPSTKYCIFHTTARLCSVSNKIRQKIRTRKAVVNVKLSCFQNTWRKLPRLVKDRQALLNRYNVVYRRTCPCGASYTGEKQRNFINRVEEHYQRHWSGTCRLTQITELIFTTEVTGSDNWRWLQIWIFDWEHKPELNANIPPMPLCILI